MIKKRVKAGLLSAALAVSVLLAGGNVLQVNAEVVGSTTASSGWGNAGLISKNDMSVTQNAVGTAEIILPDDLKIGSYYVTNLWGSENAWSGDYRKLSDEEWDAVTAAVAAGNYTRDDSETCDTLTGITAAGMFIGCSEYRSSELTVVDNYTFTYLPGHLELGTGWSAPASYSMYARKANGEWDTLFEDETNEQYIQFSWGDYWKDDYVYVLLYSSETMTDANTTVYRMFTTEDKLDAVRQTLPEWTISYTSTASTNSGLVDGGDGNWYLLTDGVFNPNYTGLFCDDNVGWWLVVDGRVDFNYNGLYCDPNVGWWKLAGGTIDWGYTGMACNEYGWWYVRNGQLDLNYTGMACNEYGWWYYQNGQLDLNYTGMACNEYGWWYYQNGQLDWAYTGMACNEYGWWYYQNGQLDWGYTGMACNEYGWWYYQNGQLDWTYTGMACNEYGWWYYQNGQLDWTYTGMACNEYGWWYYQNGCLDWTYTGPASNEYGDWYFVNGQLDWTHTW